MAAVSTAARSTGTHTSPASSKQFLENNFLLVTSLPEADFLGPPAPKPRHEDLLLIMKARPYLMLVLPA